MAHKELSVAQALKLTKEAERKEQATVVAKFRWPGEDGMIALAKAVRDKLPYVIIEGKRYSIRYKTHFGGSVYIKPDNAEFIPCGYFSLKSLQQVMESSIDE